MVKRLKCWRKFTNSGVVKSWVKPGTDRYNPHLGKGMVVSIEPRIGDWRKGKFVKLKGYNVEIDEGGYSKEKKSFKSKPQALKFVKSYMKKHDIC